MSRIFLSIALVLVCANVASADTRVLILQAETQDLAAAKCLVAGAPCGADAAKAICRSHDFTGAASYRRVDPDEVTGSVPKAEPMNCKSGSPCGAYVAVICRR